MAYELWGEDQNAPGPPHSADHQSLLLKRPRPPPATQIAENPSDSLSKSARQYLTWFFASPVDHRARYEMMTLPIADKHKIDREVELIRTVRLLCPDLKVDIRSQIGWNENLNTVFLYLYLTGRHTGYCLLLVLVDMVGKRETLRPRLVAS